MSVSSPHLAVPAVPADPLEAQQRVIRGPAALDRVVADPGLLLFAVENQHGRVDIEDQPSRHPRVQGHLVQKPIVQGTQLGQGGGGHAQQKPAKRGGLRIARQAGEVLKDAILPQQLCALDPLEAEDHRVEQRQQRLPNTVTVVALGDARLLGQQLLEPDATEETMQQIRTTIVGQGG